MGKEDDLTKKIEKVANSGLVNANLRNEARRALMVLKYEVDPRRVKIVEEEWKKWFGKGGFEKAVREEKEFQENRAKFFKKISPLERKRAIWAKKRAEEVEKALLAKEEQRLKKLLERGKQISREETRKEGREEIKKREERMIKQIVKEASRKEVVARRTEKEFVQFLYAESMGNKNTAEWKAWFTMKRGTEAEKEAVRKNYQKKIDEIRERIERKKGI